MSGFTPGTPEFNAAVAYYADLHYANPSLLALHGFDYYTNSPASLALGAAALQPEYAPLSNPLSQADYFAAHPDAGFGDYLNYVQGAFLNWYYDSAADISGIPLREGESLEFSPGQQDQRARWVLHSPTDQAITRGLSWSDVRSGIEFVGISLSLAYVGGEFLTPVADVPPEALGIGADIGVDVAANTTTGLIGTATEIAPIVADVAPVITDIVPTVADVAPAVTDIAPTVADIAPAVPNTAPSLTELAGNVKSVVGTVTTAERLLNPPPNRSINPPTIPVSKTLSPSPNESGEIPVVALLGLLLFKVI